MLSWNAGAERMFGWSAAEIIGRSVRTLVPADRQQEQDTVLASVRRGQRVPTFETIRKRKDGSDVTVAVTASPVRNDAGRIVAVSKIARDISAQKQVLTLLEDSEQRFRLLADNIAQLAWIADTAGSVFWYNRRWFEYTGSTLAEMEGWGWGKGQQPDHLDRVVARWSEHVARGEAWEDTFPLRAADGSYRWFLSRAVPIRDGGERIVYWFGTNTDITEMRDAEQRIELLLMEVNHRSKNMLAVVQALARRTVAQGGDFVTRLEQRIQALAANQDLLVNRAWASVPIGEMIAVQLGLLGETSRQVASDGPPVMIAPAAAEAIGMAIHEMATNAVKYGALSCPEGRVAIGWQVETGEGGEEFALSWTEHGGPSVAEPAASGFGMRIIADVPRAKLGAEVLLGFARQGFSWSLRCPLGSVSGNAAAGDERNAKSHA